VIFPLIFSFYPKANFSKKWKYALPAIILTSIPFIIWDEWFTRIGIWGFNPDYLSGIYLLSLPLEEVLFFICIPYACIFTYFALQHLVKEDYLIQYQRPISYVLICLLMIVGIFYIHQWYTSMTCLITALLLLFHSLYLRSTYMGRFYFTFLIVVPLFFLVNGILTGSFIDNPVVWYNNNETLDIRLGTIPVEDIIYALLLLLTNITVAEELEKRYIQRKILA
jgi:lycopene cyclase domain-containing protein